MIVSVSISNLTYVTYGKLCTCRRMTCCPARSRAVFKWLFRQWAWFIPFPQFVSHQSSQRQILYWNLQASCLNFCWYMVFRWIFPILFLETHFRIEIENSCHFCFFLILEQRRRALRHITCVTERSRACVQGALQRFQSRMSSAMFWKCLQLSNTIS